MMNLEEAHQSANKVVLGNLKRQMEENPAADLSDLLGKQKRGYTVLVQSLINGAEADSSESKAGLAISLTAQACIVHPLKSELLELLSIASSDDNAPTSLSKEHIATLNELFSKGDVLHEKSGKPHVIAIDSRIVVKVNHFSELDEAANTDYIHERIPDFPAPKCLGAISVDDTTYLFMTRAEGSSLQQAWPLLSISNKTSVRDQLEKLLSQLRAYTVDVQETGFRIGGFVSGACIDCRRMKLGSDSSIYTEKEFNDFLCNVEDRPMDMIRSTMRSDRRIVMTHSDLRPRNIMVTWDTDIWESIIQIQISAILDWEFAGWYPEHWEFVKAMHNVYYCGHPELKDWIDYIPTEVIGTYIAEYSIDNLLHSWLD